MRTIEQNTNKDTFKTILNRLREYNRITVKAHHLTFYADESGGIFKDGSISSLYTFDTLEMLNNWLIKEIEQIYWPKVFDVGMVFENENGTRFTVEFINKTHAILSNIYGIMWRIEHGSKNAICPHPTITTTELTKLIRV